MAQQGRQQPEDGVVAEFSKDRTRSRRLRVVRNQACQPLEQLRGKVVAEPVDRHEPAVRNLDRGVHAAGERHQRIGTAVDDQRRTGDAPQPCTAIPVRDDRGHLPQHSRRVIAALDRAADACAQLVGRRAIRRAADDREHAREVVRHAVDVLWIRRTPQQLPPDARLRLGKVARPARRHDRSQRQYAVRVPGRHQLADHAAHRSPHDVRGPNAEGVQQARRVEGHVLEAVRNVRGQAEARPEYRAQQVRTPERVHLLRQAAVPVVEPNDAEAVLVEHPAEGLRPAHELHAQPHDQQHGGSTFVPERLVFQLDSVCDDARHGLTTPVRRPDVRSPTCITPALLG